tara:strand:- start:1089 stop:1805 length:717 start_codon:yes stop_codon:yes gene_type:complete
MKKINKIMILADSAANPRTFPAEDACSLEETYPYLLQARFENVMFWHNIMSNVTTDKICSIAISYLNQWKPDVIILCSGINDARPEGIPETIKNLISYIFFPFVIIEKLFPPLRGVYKKCLRLLEHKIFIKIISGYRVKPSAFKRTLKRLKLIFNEADIYCLEILSADKYEMQRPGAISRKKKYNAILQNEFEKNFLKIEHLIKNNSGFNTDSIHLNKYGHKIIFKELEKKILNNYTE